MSKNVMRDIGSRPFLILSWTLTFAAIVVAVTVVFTPRTQVVAQAKDDEGSQGNPAILDRLDEIEASFNLRFDAIDSALEGLSGGVGDLGSDLSDHNTNIDGDLVAHNTNIDGDLVAHNTNLDDDLSTHDTDIKADIANLDTDVGNVKSLIEGTHLLDPLDAVVTVCADLGGGAGVEQNTGWDESFAWGLGIGLDIFGNGVQADAVGAFNNGYAAHSGSDVGIQIEACFNGIFVRQDGSVDGVSFANLTNDEKTVVNGLKDSDDLADLRDTMIDLAGSSLFVDLDAANLNDALEEFEGLDLDSQEGNAFPPTNIFQIEHDSVRDLVDDLALSSEIEEQFPNSPIDIGLFEISSAGDLCDTLTALLGDDGDAVLSDICDTISSVSDVVDTIDDIDGIVSGIENALEDIADALEVANPDDWF